MELPPFLHSRYFPRPHPPHPNDRSYYPQRHHHHDDLPPPPPPPLPPPESYRPLHPAPPPPPPAAAAAAAYNPHQSQFVFLAHQQHHHRPIADDSRRPHLYDLTRHHSPRPRVSNRTLFDEDRPRLHFPGFDNSLPDSRPDSWVDPPRFPPQDRLVRPIPLDLDHEPHHHRPFNNQILVSPYRTVDKYRHDVEGSSRFRHDFNDGFKSNYTEGFLRDRSDSRGGDDDNNYLHSVEHYVSNSRNFAFGDSHFSNPNPARDFAGNLRNYGPRYDSASDTERLWDSRDENQRWGHARPPSRELADSHMETDVNEFGNGDLSRVMPARRVPHTYDSSKLNSRSRESTQRTPRKKLQKKSALLRLQLGKPNNRNRNEDQFFSSAYFDDSDPNTLRGKGPYVFSDHRMGEEEDKEGSPVELDVSFKSNSLVAKAIVASSHVVHSDCNLTPRNRKIRKVTVPETDLSDSPLTRHIEGPVESESSKHVSDFPSSSYKDLKQREEKVIVSGSGAMCDIGSQPYSNGTYDSPGNSAMEGSFSDKSGNSVGSDGTPLIRIRKKKIFISPLSRASPPTKKNGEPDNADSSTNIYAAFQPDKGVVDSKEKTTTASMVAVHDAVLQPSLNEVTASLKADKMDESPQAVVSEKDGTDIDSDRASVPNTKRKRNSSTPPSGSLSPLENKIDKGAINIDGSVHDLHTISNCDKSLTELQIGSTSDIGGVDDVSQQSCQDGLPVLLRHGLVKEPLEAMASVRGNVNCNMSNLEKIKIHEGLLNFYSSVCDVHNASSSDNGFFERQEKIIVSDVDADCKLPSLNHQLNVLLENDNAEGFREAIPSVGGNAIVGSSSAVETKIHESTVNADGSNHNASTTSISNNALTNSDGKTTISETGYMDDSIKQLCTDGATILLENGPMKAPSKAKVSVGGNLNVGSDKKYAPKVTRKRKARNTQLGLSSPSMGDVPVNRVRLAHAADTTLHHPVKDLISAEKEVMVSVYENFDNGSQPCTDNYSILHGNSLTTGSSEAEILVGGGVNVGPNGSSPNYRNKRKVFAPALSSPMLSHTQERPVSTDNPTFCVGVPLNIGKGLTPSDDNIAVCSNEIMCSAGLLPHEKQTTILLENSMAGGSFEAMGSVEDGLSLTDNSSIREQKSPCLSGLEGEQKENTTMVMATTNHQNDIIDTKSRREKTGAACAAEEHDMFDIETAQHGIPIESQDPDSDQRLPGLDMERDSYLLVKHDFPLVSNTLSLCADGNSVSTTKSSDEPMKSVPSSQSLTGPSETFSVISGSHMLNPKLSLGQISNEKVCMDDQKLDEKPVSESVSVLSSFNTSSQNTETNLKSGHNGNGYSINAKTASFLSQDFKKPTQALTSSSIESSVRKNQQSSAVPKVSPAHSFLHFSASKKTAPLSHKAKPGTWHRTGNPSALPRLGKNSYSSPVPPQRQLPGKDGKVQSSSYIRKGNSLVRKPSPVAALPRGSHVLSSSVYRLNPSGIDEMKKSTGFESKVDIIDPQNCLRTGLNATFERPKTPPLSSIKLSNCTTISSHDDTALLLADPPQNGCSETISDPSKHTGNVDVLKSSEDATKSFGTPENQSGLALERQSVPDEGNLASVNLKKIIYVKRKSNQLVAASKSSDLSVQDADKTQASSSDGYYKRRKNQLIRKSSESHSMQRVAFPDESLISEGQRAPKVILSRISSKSRPGKGLAKTYKPSKFSLVWTLRDTQSSKKENSLQHQKVWPHLFPWKRATYWRSFMQSLVPISNNSSLSTISQKLLLSRKRDAIYTRSTRGFSLRRLKLLSVGGLSLKWSKSIERNSKKANEEATLAVAAAEKKKREQKGAACVVAGTKSRNHSSRKSVHSIELRPGERIFRVGSFRYKMDPTRRTLQRISDEESCLAALQSEKDAKKSYVPRRLVIGNDEYVRIGNGNQLVRDPKKRTRILASEKVRWSLHTARLRLARKRQYCQFFTRFGKCNKDDGKCPYIHDPSKIAVCTKFLNGSCSNPNCKLTHKVIPERMQDCSYFLQGLCSNKSCPYRHVNVNPNAPICEGFLRGYCVDGNECRKKHSYVCPIFEATGICPQGSKCKLHHPKNRTKGKKRKPSRQHKNIQGRYFDSGHTDIVECRTAVSEKHSTTEDDYIFCQEGRFTDFIIVDVDDEEAGETKDPARGQTTLFDDPGDVQVEEIDELIKPIRIMNKNIMTESSPAIDSTSERTASYVSEESNLL